MVKFSNLFFSLNFMLHRSPTTPQMQSHLRFGLFPVRSPLLGESFLFSFPTGTKMFQFPALASYLVGWQSFRLPGCPIRKSMDQRIFAPPHSLSQLITSFIACKSLGIHRTPLNTFYQNYCQLYWQRWIYLKLVLYLTLNRSLYSSVFTLLILNLLVELLYNMSKIVRENNNTLCRCKDWLRLSFSLAWRITDSNRWPPACKAGALASWANPPYIGASCSPRQSWTADLYIISVAL